MFKKLFKWKDTNVQTTIIHPTPPEDIPAIVKDISEPVLAIVEAMKDNSNWGSRWELGVEEKHESPTTHYQEYIEVLTDTKTGNIFKLCTRIDDWKWPVNHQVYLVDCKWANTDEKKLLQETMIGLIKQIKQLKKIEQARLDDLRVVEEYIAQQAANKAERERLMGDYCK